MVFIRISCMLFLAVENFEIYPWIPWLQVKPLLLMSVS
uniref:Uncharacterized protein n=1 Tax=Rhizophora mucronata TaxID=61149 RepID=A0A2P2J132_RHIMU